MPVKILSSIAASSPAVQEASSNIVLQVGSVTFVLHNGASMIYDLPYMENGSKQTKKILFGLQQKQRKMWSGIAEGFGIKPALLLVNATSEICRARNKQLNRLDVTKLERMIKKFQTPTLDEWEIYI